ncbi:hypothetical protein CYLTODRAFT_489611 [Cylindrobasidium torrendii FP15055 ss-10]|uniref:F-box domain-containing protein n=1 Tax=Cylindrobasidium torrendii FP15055 ss-10 TaxID=1314674 RepID=A0A0D7BG28_9AGAR|nr:hypothetical protein CYLTODRAFT_489611 [Cylindrobasidium torrendii FP15055 ss-10]
MSPGANRIYLQFAEDEVLFAIAQHTAFACTNADGTLDVLALYPLAVSCSQMLEHVRPYYMSKIVLSERRLPSAMLNLLRDDLSCLSHVQELIVQGIRDPIEWHHLQATSSLIPDQINITIQDIPIHRIPLLQFKALCVRATNLTLDHCTLTKDILSIINTLTLDGFLLVAPLLVSQQGLWGQSCALPSVKYLCLLPGEQGEQHLHTRVHAVNPATIQEVVISVDCAGLPRWVSTCKSTLRKATITLRDIRKIPGHFFQEFTALTHITISWERDRMALLRNALPHSLQSITIIFKGEEPTVQDWASIANVLSYLAINEAHYLYYHTHDYSPYALARICGDMERYGNGPYPLSVSIIGSAGSYIECAYPPGLRPRTVLDT